jgi:hypothetical protein
MSFCRRDVATALLRAIRDESKFIDAVADAIAAGRIKSEVPGSSRLGEKIIMLYYQDEARLFRKLEEVVDFMY